VQYVALILKKGMDTPNLVRIKGGDSLETRFLSFYRKAIQTKQDDLSVSTSSGNGSRMR